MESPTKPPTIESTGQSGHDQKPPRGKQPTITLPETSPFPTSYEDTSRPSKKPKTCEAVPASTAQPGIVAAAAATDMLPSLQQVQATTGPSILTHTPKGNTATTALCNPDPPAAYAAAASGMPFHQTGQGINLHNAYTIPNIGSTWPAPSSSAQQQYASRLVTQLNVEEALLIERLKLQYYRNLLQEKTKQERECQFQGFPVQPTCSTLLGSAPAFGSIAYTNTPHSPAGTSTSVTGQDLRLSPSLLRFVATSNDFKLSPSKPTSNRSISEGVTPMAGVLQPLPRRLLLPADEDNISKYQCLLRKHIEAFEASQDDIESHSRGRSRKIVVGQVGIRCRHCRGHLAKGSIYFPGNLSGIYQSAQNMSLHHINPRDEASRCKAMPSEDIHQFETLLSCKSNIGGGKGYWSEAANFIGLMDTPHGIRFIGRQPVSKAA